jgi:general secretion pathway protein H
VELLVVLVLIALASGLAGLALRQGDEARLEREAVRLAALLEAARAEARATGVAVRFELAEAGSGDAGAAAFRFIGLHPDRQPPDRWLELGTSARIEGARALRLGPEPLIGAQRIVLALGDRQLPLSTDGLAPFAPESAAEAADGQARPSR